MSDKATLFRSIPSAITLGENLKVPRTVQVLKIGTYFDERYGTLEINQEMLRSMKKNFDAKVRKIDLACDYKHAAEDVAAGWFTNVNLLNQDTELWAEFAWTPNGEKVLGEREFRYISAEFSLNYVDNETLAEFGPTLLGAGLTNRPVVKGMQPVVLEEYNHKRGGLGQPSPSEKKGENKMDEKDKMIQELQAKIAELEAKLKGGSHEEEMSDLQKKAADMEAKCSELQKQVDEFTAEKAKAAEEKALAEKRSKFEKLMSEGKAVKAQEEAFLAGDMDKFVELSETPKLETVGGEGGEKKAIEKDPEAKLIELAEEKVKSKEFKDMAAALSAVRKANPDLVKAIRQ